jgi:hypothetical protein
MKKVLFSIAIVAAGLLVASCGNKSAANGEGADSTEVVEGQIPSDFVHYESACYTFDCPEALKQGKINDTIFLSNAPDRDANISVNLITDDKPTAETFKQFAEKKIAEKKRYFEVLQEPKVDDKSVTIRCKDDQRGMIVEFFYVLGTSGNTVFGNFAYKPEASNKYEAAVEPFIKSIVVK